MAFSNVQLTPNITLITVARITLLTIAHDRVSCDTIITILYRYCVAPMIRKTVLQQLTLPLLSLTLAACISDAQIPVTNNGTITKQAPNYAPRQAMVVTANPLASKTGADVLRAGGSATDAAIAIAAVLSLVEPQSSGLGGGAYMVHFDNSNKELSVYDGRETAPAKAKQDAFLQANGEPMGFINAKHSGLSTGVPGVISMLALAHADHGKLPWGVHFEQAKALAVNGFSVSPRLHNSIARTSKYIPKTREQGPLDTYQYFFDDKGVALPIGATLKNPEYAETLSLIAQDPQNFYRGIIAEQIVEQVSKMPRAGSLTLQDMADFKAQKRSALCVNYKTMHACGPQPSSSWVAVGAILGMLEHAPAFSEAGANDPTNWAIFAEAQRLAYADRDQYVADSAFIDVPLQGLLNPNYLLERAKLISPEKAKETIEAGQPWDYQAAEKKVAVGVDATIDMPSTTHFVVVDGDGNVVSMTASIESIFGSARMAGGMFLNNQLTDFSFRYADATGTPIANRLQGGKRPRSSMSPTIVLDEDGEFLMASGSPGGNSIIAYTTKSLIGVIDWQLSPQDAVALPNMVARGQRVRIEKERASAGLIQGLRDYGYNVSESAGENSGLSMVLRHTDGRLQGGVDPRREGVIEIIELQ